MNLPLVPKLDIAEDSGMQLFELEQLERERTTIGQQKLSSRSSKWPLWLAGDEESRRIWEISNRTVLRRSVTKCVQMDLSQ